MTIRSCLLDARNATVVDGMSIGDRIRTAGRERLWQDREAAAVDTIVIHYISAVEIDPGRPFNTELILKIFCDYGVSSHYLIGRRGGVLRLVPEEERAWHAGGSIMPEPDNRRGVNEFSIGIELMATATSGFTRRQYGSLAVLCADIEKRRNRRFIYTGHDRIAGERAVNIGLRKDVKVDPGKLFDWERFFTLLDERRGRD